MAERSGKFTESSARRIGKVVRGWEAQVRGEDDGTGQVLQNGIFWQVFKNTSSETVPAYGLMRITTDIIVDAIQNHILKCTKPDTTFSRRYAVNGPVPIAANGYGLCRVTGLVEVAYDSGTPDGDEGWGPKPGQWTAAKNYPQCLLVEDNKNSTNRIMLATLQPIDQLLGKATSTVANRASGTINIWQGTMGSEAVISSLTISAFNVGPALASGDWVQVGWINGQAVVSKLCGS